MRKDGRAVDDLRPIKITPNFLTFAHGSCLIEVGETRVLCTAMIEETVPRWMRGSGKGWVTAEYSMLPGSTDRRTSREVTRGKPGGRTMEIQRLIGRSLRTITDMSALGQRTIWLDCDVLQADGGTRCASITGAFVALCLALQKLVDDGALERLPLLDTVAAVSAGVVDGTCVLDDIGDVRDVRDRDHLEVGVREDLPNFFELVEVAGGEQQLPAHALTKPAATAISPSASI